jgi:hypothetical protein
VLNVVNKVAKADADQVKRDYWAIFNDIEAPPGHAAVAVATARAAEFEGNTATATRAPSTTTWSGPSWPGCGPATPTWLASRTWE